MSKAEGRRQKAEGKMGDAACGFARRLARLTLALSLFTFLTGCAPSGPAPREQLSAAYKELEGPNPNYVEMARASEVYLQAEPQGTAVADAYYLRGRAMEEKAQRDPASPQKDWAEAYNWYREVLKEKPRPGLEGLAHAGLGNVLYFQDRYASAISELSTAHELLEQEADKAWTLYRIGLCHQRMGQWDEADKFFAAVQQRYAGSIQAQRARDRQGARAFWVQVAVANAKAAQQVVDNLKRQGLAAQPFVDTARNIQVVRVGPIGTYDQANATKTRVTALYRDAIVVP